MWVEVDPQKAYEKACQALREGAPEIRRKMQVTEPSEGEEDRSSPAEQTASGERVQESADAKESPKEDSSAAAAAKDTKVDAESKSAEEDTRNDEMQDSERS